MTPRTHGLTNQGLRDFRARRGVPAALSRVPHRRGASGAERLLGRGLLAQGSGRWQLSLELCGCRKAGGGAWGATKRLFHAGALQMLGVGMEAPLAVAEGYYKGLAGQRRCGGRRGALGRVTRYCDAAACRVQRAHCCKPHA